jgi:tape measure domain-containing protein
MPGSAAEITVRAKDEASAVLQNATRSLDTLKGAGNEASKGLGTLGGALAGLKQHLGTVVSLTLAITALHAAMNALGNVMGAVKGSFIDFNAQLEQNRTAFTNMLGSAKQADVFLRQLSDFANKTPFKFGELTTASQRMLAFGFSAEQVLPLLTAVGNQAALMGGSTEQINRLTIALGQMQAKGKVSGDELLQLTEAGVKVNDVFAIMAQQSGRTTEQIAADAKKGILSSQDFIAAFETYTGRFGDVMGAQSRTFNGAMSTIQDTLQSAGARAFKPFFDLISEGAIKFADFLQTERFERWVATVSSAAQRAADAVRGFFKLFQDGGISGLLDDMKEKILSVFNLDGHDGGANFIITFVKGMYDAATGVLSGALDDITGYISDYFIGKSPPPKGPLSGILEGGAKTMQAFLDGMKQAVEGGGVSDVAGGVFATLSGALTSSTAGAGLSVDFKAMTEAIRSGTLSMDELKVAAEGVDDVTRSIAEHITDIQDAQSILKDQIDDIKYAYDQQIDPLQRQVDTLKDVVDWTAKRRDLELEIANNQLAQQMAGDPTLKGLQSSLSALTAQQRGTRTAPIDRTVENRIATLQGQLRGVPTGKEGEGRRSQINDEIAGLRERQRTEKDGDTDASRALQARIDQVKNEIDQRKAVFQSKIDENKQEQDTIGLREKGLALARDLQALPLEEKIAKLKKEEQEKIDPLQQQYDILDRQRSVLERQQAHWHQIGQEIKDALQPLQDALKAQQQLEAEQKKAAGGSAAGKTGGLPTNYGPGLRTQPVGSGGAVRGEAGSRSAGAPGGAEGGIGTGLGRLDAGVKEETASDKFIALGMKVGESIVQGAINFIKQHFGQLIGGAIGGSIGGAVLGPAGALIGGLLGSQIGGELQKRLGPLFGEAIKSAQTWIRAEITKFKIVDTLFGRKEAIKQVAEDIFSPILDAVKRLIDWLGEQAPRVGAQLIKWGEQFVDFIKPHIGPMVEALGGLAAKLYEWLLSKAPEVRDKLLKWGDEFVHWIAPKIPGLLEEIGKLYIQLEAFLLTTVGKIGLLLLKWGEELVAWVAPYIPPLLKELGELSLKLFGWIGERAKELPGKLVAWGGEFVAWVAPKIPGLLKELALLFADMVKWVAEQIPTLTVKMAGWAGEFAAWAITVWPKLLIGLQDLLAKISVWVVTDAVPEIAKAIATWVPAFMGWAKDILDPSNPNGLEMQLLLIGKGIQGWITDFATHTLPQAAAAFVAPFMKPFDVIGTRITAFLTTLKTAINTVTQAIAGKDVFAISIPSINADTSTPSLGGGGNAAGGVGQGGAMPGMADWFRNRGKQGNAIDEEGRLLGHGDFPNVGSFVKTVADVTGLGGVYDVLSGAVKDGGGALFEAALKKFGVGLDLPAGFAGFGKGLASKVVDLAKDSISDLVKKLMDGFGGSNEAVRAALGMLSGDGATWDGWCLRFMDNLRGVLGLGRSGAHSAREEALSLQARGLLHPGFGPPGTAQYWSGLPFGHIDLNGPLPGQAISTGPWGIGVISQAAQFSANTAGWAPIQQLRTGGITVTEGVYHLHPQEAVIPLDRAGSRIAGGDTYHITVEVAGSVITEGQLVDTLHKGFLAKQRRTGPLGLK